ncbi:MAG: hypothetical protein J6A54_04390 [Clostridia bacterium]|nr:hypothetical protein [Clostridia bacterium]
MYCVKCGVELSAGQEKCPICETKVYHPDFIADGHETYPKNNTPPDKFERKGLMFIWTAIFLIPFVLCLVCDLSIHDEIVWAGYAMGGIALAYGILALPFWFRHPNPIIFVPCDFAGILLYLLYINLATQGAWFLSFAFPVVGGIGVIVTTVVCLEILLKSKGSLFVYGGATIALGALMVLVEFLVAITFRGGFSKFVWSEYPLISLFIIGMMLIIIGICKPLRSSLKKKFFL